MAGCPEFQLLARPSCSWHRSSSLCAPSTFLLPVAAARTEQASLTAGSLTASFFLLLPHNNLSFLQGLVPSSQAREENIHLPAPFPCSSFILLVMDGLFSPLLFLGYLRSQEADTGSGLRRWGQETSSLSSAVKTGSWLQCALTCMARFRI